MRALIFVGLIVLCIGGCAGFASLYSQTRKTATLAPVNVVRSYTGPTQSSRATSTVVPATPTHDKPGWRLVFSDEFDAAQIDAEKWQLALPWGSSNPPEAQHYVSDAFELQDGLLRIRADQREYKGFSYTSGVITTFDTFSVLYGYFEIRARIPKGKGLWSAFWLLTKDDQSWAEIDVFEFLGHQPQVLYTYLHYHDEQGAHQNIGKSFTGRDYSRAFHTFAVDWSPSVVIWYVDDVERYRLTEHVPQEPLYLIANLAIGGKWPSNPDRTTSFPAYYEIDYVRVYQR